MTVTGQSCTPTSSGATPISYRDGLIDKANDSVTVNRPAGTVNGDLLLAAFTIRSHAVGIITVPSGWTQVRLDIYGTKNVQTGIWSHTAAGTDPVSWTWSASTSNVGAILSIAAYSGASAVDTSGGQTQTNATVTAPSVSASAAGSRLVGVFSENNNATMSGAAGMTTRLTTVTTGSLVTQELTDEGLYNSGTTGVRTVTLGTSRDNIGQLVVLTPAVAPTASTISYVGANNGLGTTSVPLVVPTGVQTGDLLLVTYATRKSTPTVTPPAGWTQVRTDTWDASNLKQATYWRIATSADVPGTTTYTWASSDGTSRATGMMAAYRGVDQTSPVHLHDKAVNVREVTVTAPTLTPTRADTKLLGIFVGTDGKVVSTTASGMTPRSFATSGTTTSDVTVELEDQPWPSASTATGTRAITMSASVRGIGYALALKAESYPLAALSWTAETTSTYADGYRLGRVVGGTETTSTLLSPYTLSSYTAGTTTRLAGGTTYTMNLKTRFASWLSTSSSYTFTTITTC